MTTASRSRPPRQWSTTTFRASLASHASIDLQMLHSRSREGASVAGHPNSWRRELRVWRSCRVREILRTRKLSECLLRSMLVTSRRLLLYTASCWTSSNDITEAEEYHVGELYDTSVSWRHVMTILPSYLFFFRDAKIFYCIFFSSLFANVMYVVVVYFGIFLALFLCCLESMW